MAEENKKLYFDIDFHKDPKLDGVEGYIGMSDSDGNRMYSEGDNFRLLLNGLLGGDSASAETAFKVDCRNGTPVTPARAIEIGKESEVERRATRAIPDNVIDRFRLNLTQAKHYAKFYAGLLTGEGGSEKLFAHVDISDVASDSRNDLSRMCEVAKATPSGKSR